MLHVSEPTLRQVLSLWGPGKYPAILFMDGKAFRPDGKIAANLIPAAFGLRGIDLTTYTGWGDWSNPALSAQLLFLNLNTEKSRMRDICFSVTITSHNDKALAQSINTVVSNGKRFIAYEMKLFAKG